MKRSKLKGTDASLFLFILALAMGISGCKKDVEIKNTNTQNFNHVFSLEGNQKCYTITETDDQGFLLVGSQDGYAANDENEIVIIKTDPYGKLQWKNTITNDSFWSPFISRQPNGNIYICPNYGSHFFKLDKNGNQILKVRFYTPVPQADYFSYIMEKDNGQMVFIRNSEVYLGLNIIGTFFIFDKDGIPIKSLPIRCKSNEPNSYYLNVYKAQDTSTYYYYGIEKGTPNPRIFVAKQINSAAGKRVVVDPDNTTNQNFPNSSPNIDIKHLIMPDGKLMLYNTQLEASGKYRGYIAVIDDNLNKQWDMELKIGLNGTYPHNIAHCPDGNYLISGSCKIENNLLLQPFACKIDPNGRILWSKIYTTPYSGSFNCSLQLSDGSFVFGGTTNSFGSAKNLGDLFIMKTDKDGNLN